MMMSAEVMTILAVRSSTAATGVSCTSDFRCLQKNKSKRLRVKIPITERRSPDIQRRKPIKYQAGMRSRHSGTRTCRRYGSSWESSR
ncbi:hypothetical protein TNCV_4996491 [Trichonephila clavipes]|nr:hypothetical protein TNCV_4996491 [Trichonephila clavipes]